jgi:outer membrane scaffolding protein for murein synthesis (MipA/OmpV family)
LIPIRCAAFAGLSLSLLTLCPPTRAAATEEAPAATAEPAPPAPPEPSHWEGAIGATASYRPEYSGSARSIAKISPGFFLRYGRFTVTNASGFVTRRADDVARGLAMDLGTGDRFRANLALRFDAGRGESTSTALTGMGDIKPTVRGRLNLGWKLDGPWRLGGSWSVDLLGKGGGHFGDVSGGFEQRLPGNTVFSGYLTVSAAGDRYMQTYFGVSEEQSARSGYAVYKPSSGLRDVGFNLGFRTDLGEDWVFLAGGSASRLVGQAARSPLTGNPNGWGLSAGLAWRF